MDTSFAASDLQYFYPDCLLTKMEKVIFFAEVRRTFNLLAPTQNAALYFGLPIHGMDIAQNVVGWELDIYNKTFTGEPKVQVM